MEVIAVLLDIRCSEHTLEFDAVFNFGEIRSFMAILLVTLTHGSFAVFTPYPRSSKHNLRFDADFI